MYAAAAACGVASNFGSPIGGTKLNDDISKFGNT